MRSSPAVYSRLYSLSLSDPRIFWAEIAEDLDWSRKWDYVLSDTGDAIPHWFVGGGINAYHNCLDRHGDAWYGDQPALLYESPVTETSRVLACAELQDCTARLGGAMQMRGVGKGDRVFIYIPNSPEAVIAMLACARIGAIHSVVFGGFAVGELATRIDDARPKLMLTASCGIEGARTLLYQPILDEAYRIASHRPGATIIWQREQHEADLSAPDILDWQAELGQAKPADGVPVAATDSLYILYYLRCDRTAQGDSPRHWRPPGDAALADHGQA